MRYRYLNLNLNLKVAHPSFVGMTQLPSVYPLRARWALAWAGEGVSALKTAAVGVPRTDTTHTSAALIAVYLLVTVRVHRSRCEPQGRQAQAREVDVKVQHLTLLRHDRVHYLRALASPEPSLCTLASRLMPSLARCLCAQDNLSIAAVSIGEDVTAGSAALDLEPRRYGRGHTMARRSCRFLRALAKRDLTCSAL